MKKVKTLTPQNFEREVNKMLSKKERWNSSKDKELCQTTLDNVYSPVYTRGISVLGRLVQVSGILCTLQVLYNPYMVISRGWAIAGHFTDTVSQIVVFVDDDFMRLSADTQKFIVYHEIGHIEYGHYRHTCLLRDLDKECEADAYAAKHCPGVAQEALTELLQYIDDEESIKEISLRIEHVNND